VRLLNFIIIAYVSKIFVLIDKFRVNISIIITPAYRRVDEMNKRNYKIIITIITALLLLSLCSCGGKAIKEQEETKTDPYSLYIEAAKRMYNSGGLSIDYEGKSIEQTGEGLEKNTEILFHYEWNDFESNPELKATVQSIVDDEVFSVTNKYIKDGVMYGDDGEKGFKYVIKQDYGYDDPIQEVRILIPLGFTENIMLSSAADDVGDNKRLVFSINGSKMWLGGDDMFLMYNPYYLASEDYSPSPYDNLVLEAILDADGNMVKMMYSYSYSYTPPGPIKHGESHVQVQVSAYNIKIGNVKIDFPADLETSDFYKDIDVFNAELGLLN